ncbi:hypothetical protein SUGI_0274810 [Cryptomeria japonica]|uniref:protein NRT1/ PTR FAMILY 4.4 n=1 Tax=Cryptomeria japonica TaxID=3369 RepID=UPI002408C54D|nr:protein NRT1/ PTR FAMILY 4.4 [Cryptomeria japonica]GLJ16297.1 hypothetical protein SUGI_0274810 [Cryptomeria japonica]
MVPASAPALAPAPAPTPAKHGGLRATLFINGVQALETTAIAAVGNNLITYLVNDMHYSLSKSANIVTNFVATTFLLSILGGFLSDSYLGSFLTILIFGLIELIGYIVIAVEAHVPSLKPEACDVRGSVVCEEAKGVEAVLLYVGLYTIAVGSGCLKPNIIAYGGDQLSCEGEANGRRAKYFNMAYLSFCVGEVIALTLLIWIQTRFGMDVGFGVSAGLMLFALLILTSATPFYLNRPPQGSIFTHILQILVAVHKKKLEHASNQKMLSELSENTSRRGPERQSLSYPDQFRYLEQGAMVEEESREVEQLKLVIRVMPIFGCTIVTNCILAQLQTFSVEQASSMESRVAGFQVPAASVQAIPYVIMVGVVPLYVTVFVPLLRRMTGKESGISQLQRIGIGLFVSTLSMVTAAVVESKRKAVAPQKLSILWIAPQFIIFGFSEMFTAVGLLEFFYSQSVAGMQSFLTALTYCSYSFGFFLSSALVSIVNLVTKTRNQQGWLSHNNLNEDHLDLFYWLLSTVSFLNFFNYIFWSRWFKYHPSQSQG